jgi:2-C-methyl-D-erythritol 4-phosphate cytidylyltransferase
MIPFVNIQASAVLPCAGSGRRMGSDVPKQFLSLAGRPIFLHSLEQILLSPSVDEIVIVAPPGEEGLIQSVLPSGTRVPVIVVPGGENRQDSARLGVEATRGDAEIIIIHDAVRPFVQADQIEALIRAVQGFGAAALAVPVRDTLKRARKEIIIETVDRDNLWQMQTPQGFRADWIRSAHRLAFENGWAATDDTALVERLGHPVRIVMGDPRNFKITTPEDLDLAERLIRSPGRVGERT